jgi:hypothetical protein
MRCPQAAQKKAFQRITERPFLLGQQVLFAGHHDESTHGQDTARQSPVGLLLRLI